MAVNPGELGTAIAAALKTNRKTDMTRIIKDPGAFIKREDFDTWWRATRRWIASQDGLSDIQKILAVLSRMSEPPADNWAAKEEDKYQKFLDEGRTDEIIWGNFVADLEKRWAITHKTEAAKAKIYALKQERRSVDEFLDEFEHLLELSKLGDETGKFLLEQNATRRITEQVSSIDETYASYLEKVRAKGRQFEGHAIVIRAGQTTSSSGDRKTSSGTTYGGTGKPMEVDKMGTPRKCYNCDKPGHIAKDCRMKKDGNQAKRFPGKCYNCGIEGHRASDCRKPKKLQAKVVAEGEGDDTGASKAEEEADKEDFQEGSD